VLLLTPPLWHTGHGFMLHAGQAVQENQRRQQLRASAQAPARVFTSLMQPPEDESLAMASASASVTNASASCWLKSSLRGGGEAVARRMD
jgi:hypothetical protein